VVHFDDNMQMIT